MAFVLSSCQTHFVGGWLPWFQTSANRADELNTIGNAGALYNEVSPFWYGAHNDAANAQIGVSISPNGAASSLAPTVAALKAQGLLVIPTVADGTSAGSMRTIIGDPARRLVHEQQLVDLTVQNGYDGVDLDYEVFAFGDHIGGAENSVDADNWVAFIHDLSGMLHAQGKLLAVTVPPTWQTQGINVPVIHGYPFYSQSRIAADVDRLRLMVYDWSVSFPGPMAPMFWDNWVIDYSTNVAHVPAAKLQLGVPAYGRHWQSTKDLVCPDKALQGIQSMTMKAAPGLAAAHGVAPVRDPNGSGEMTFSWNELVTGPRTSPVPPTVTMIPPFIIGIAATSDPSGLHQAERLTPPTTQVTCTVHHTVFYPDAASIQQRATAAMAAGWHGIFIWALGYETPDTYPALSNIGP